MEWTRLKPTQVEKLYLYQTFTEWPVRIGRLKKGNWRYKQNPDKLYLNSERIDNLDASFCGPIPEPPNKAG